MTHDDAAAMSDKTALRDQVLVADVLPPVA
jgi:hypothetical protein